MGGSPLDKAQKVVPGTVIAGRYIVTREIGRGGMALVYEGKHADIGKPVAIKVLSAEFVTSPVVVERFLREARAAAAVRSPYICDVYDTGKLEDGRPFLVMELLTGESLYERMVRVRLFDPVTTVRIITHVARGLTKAHEANIVHRDLKPENIFLTVDEEGQMLAKILDFGLAKFYAPATEGGATARLTREGAIFGTPAYMSPEQVQGQGAVDHRADTWALGCIAYECLTGRTVWSTDKGIAMTFAQIASSPLPNLNKYRPDLPRAAQVWFSKSLHRDIDVRYQTPKELAEAFASAMEENEPSGLVSAEPETDTTEPAPIVSRESDVPPPPSPRREGELGSAVAKLGSPSVADVGTSQSLKGSVAPPPKSGGSRVALALVGIAVVGGAAVAGWMNRPAASLPPKVAPPVASSATASAKASAAPVASSAPEALPVGPKWSVTVGEAQAKIASGDFDDAAKKLKDAFDNGGAAAPRNLSEHLAAFAQGKGTCKLSALSRLRPYATTGGTVSRPIILRTKAGTVAIYSDDHEGGGRIHAYATLLDASLRPTALPIDVTPEAETVTRLDAKAVGDQIALAFVDARGQAAALYSRWLDERGRIVGPSTSVGPARAGSPSITSEGGNLWIAWEERQEGEHTDLMVRKVPGTGQAPPATRLTDLRKVPQKVGPPQIGMQHGALDILFRLDRDNNRVVESLRVPVEDGLPPASVLSEPKGHSDHVTGTRRALSPTTEKADTPQLACGVDGCFAVWHIEKPTAGGGANAAFLDPKNGQMVWRKKFASSGGRPSVAIGVGGIGRIAWLEQGKVKTAQITRDGVGPASILARVAGDQPPPSLVVGATPNDWTIAWLDFEAGKLEPYALSATCP